MNKYLLEQLSIHKSMQPQDIIKMCYQATFGVEHLFNDKMKEYLEDEFKQCEDNEYLYEEISEEYSRVNLGNWKKKYSNEELWNLFVNSKQSSDNSFEKLMNEYLETLKNIWDENKMKQMRECLNNYYSLGIKPVHHSKIYIDIEHPHYRLVKSKLLKEFINENHSNV